VKGLVLSVPASGQGKTTVTLGLLRALRKRGLDIVSAKSGPDYIDPAFHAAATGRACVTLDAWAASPEQLRARAAEMSAEWLIVEGAMGLFDGAADGTPRGRGGTADLAAAMELPVILVVDVARAGQGVAAIVEGLARFRNDVRVSGVILNRVGSARHGEMVARAVGEVTPVLGILPRRDDLAMPERHLGLVQATERVDLKAVIERAAAWISAHCDLDQVLKHAYPVMTDSPGTPKRLPPLGQRIAIASDVAFGFAYAHMLDDWRVQGAEILPFSPLADHAPDPSADTVFLPGGYPELHAGSLANAATFREGMIGARDRGALIYGECGGYMVLGRRIVDAGGRSHPMLGLLDLETSFETPERHLGYRKLRTDRGPFPAVLMGHEFHYSRTLKAEGMPLFEMEDAAGTPLGPAGLIDRRVMGSFAHVIEPG